MNWGNSRAVCAPPCPALWAVPAWLVALECLAGEDTCGNKLISLMQLSPRHFLFQVDPKNLSLLQIKDFIAFLKSDMKSFQKSWDYWKKTL